MREPHGQGVDVVPNSLSGDLLHKLWQCVAKLRIMVEIGKRDFVGHGHLRIHEFANNRSFFGLELMLLARERPQKIQW
ncbi:hypothetical protein ASPWEDRAFT_40189 [Aspergillus wentii DTO 134E9]|uniref:Uncharacterized protein n=1 Tax=Aspergillus wentii DTO 134E9 TaxID=1073089 RepID=A0A1L9RJF0_ASPWE|nr:uncharacterized protein ASPWEDRAFT_40189 [Aspergillus wentii DTO 134E9]OJJ35059.1 hypothetical protein ASPWEDRAFT_40189 [Aspergillus wentii DTO 134E9]